MLPALPPDLVPWRTLTTLCACMTNVGRGLPSYAVESYIAHIVTACTLSPVPNLTQP